MENTLRVIKRRLKIRTHKFQEGDHYNGHIHIEEFQRKAPDISRHEEASTVQIAQLVATQPRHAQGLLSGASGDKVEHKSIREENGAAKPLEPTTSSQTKSAINVRKSRIGTSIFTEKSANKPPKELVDRLSHAMLRSAFKENRRYIPEGKLDLLIHRSSIRKDLRSAHNKQRPPWDRLQDARKAYKLASLICPSRGLKIASMEIASRPLDQKKLEYRKIYAILLLVGKATSISDFVKYAISDQELPLVRCEVSEEHKQRFKCSHSLACQSKPNSVISCFCSWGEQDTQDFEEKQWRVLAPIFKDSEDEAICHKDLEDACVLPFCKWTCSAKGGTACIYRAEIHDNHHRFSRTRKHSDVFAVKQLLKPVRVGLQQRDLPYEINVLKGILKPLHQNNHLINILASFRIEGIDYIILPWAQSDLLGYWRYKNPSPSPSIRTVKWLLEQCHGLACALRNIHRWPTYTNSRLYYAASSNRTNGGEHEPLVLFGCHGDIKPENILWLDNGGLGILKLADFGTARFDAEGTPSPVNLDVPTTPGYRPPESDSATTISSSWDIWGLGCVYLEFVTWLSNGWTGVDTFTRDRLAPDHNQKYSPMNTTTFYEVPKRDSPSPRLKPVVYEHLEKVSGKLPHPVVLERFLDYIMERMVIVESQTAKRSNAAEVVQKTEEILNAFAKATNRRGRMGSLKDKLHI